MVLNTLYTLTNRILITTRGTGTISIIRKLTHEGSLLPKIPQLVSGRAGLATQDSLVLVSLLLNTMWTVNCAFLH